MAPCNNNVCGNNGQCINQTVTYICLCNNNPYTNVGDFSINPANVCEYNIKALHGLWGVCGLAWFVNLIFCCVTCYRMYIYVPHSQKKQLEMLLLTAKALFSSLFLIVACLEISSNTRIIGIDFTTTLAYCFACAFFWVEWLLFLITPTLSSVTSIAQAIAPKPMRLYRNTTPFFILFCVVATFIMMETSNNNLDLDTKEIIIRAHIILLGSATFIFMFLFILALNAILSKFQFMLSTNTTKNNARSKIEHAENRIRGLRFDQTIIFSFFPTLIILFGAVNPLLNMVPYFVPLAYTLVPLITIRFVLMSHQTIQIHLERGKSVNQTIEEAEAGQNQDDDGLTSDISPFSSLESPRTAISKIALRRRRKPKFINAMTRVEEEKTNAMSKIEQEPLSAAINTKDFSQSYS